MIPWGRVSSAYGYSQAKTPTWDDYKRETDNSWADRSDFSDNDGVYATDQTYGKTQLLITGEDARALLSRGLPLDIDEGQFAIGQVQHSHINHIGVSVIRNPNVDGQPQFEVWVMRGFAKSLMDFLTHSAATLR